MNHFVIKCDSLNVMKLDLFMEKPVILIVYNQLNIKEKKYRLQTRIANQTPVTLMLLCMLDMDSSTEVSLTIYIVVLFFYVFIYLDAYEVCIVIQLVFLNWCLFGTFPTFCFKSTLMIDCYILYLLVFAQFCF